jgi:hypothetical protein
MRELDVRVHRHLVYDSPDVWLWSGRLADRACELRCLP